MRLTKRAQMAASYVIGGRSKSVFTRSTGGLRLAGVKLDPRALRALIGMPLSEFRDTTVACADLGVTALSELEERIANLRVGRSARERVRSVLLAKNDG